MHACMAHNGPALVYTALQHMLSTLFGAPFIYMYTWPTTCYGQGSMIMAAFMHVTLHSAIASLTLSVPH